MKYLFLDTETGGLGLDKSLLTLYMEVTDEKFNSVGFFDLLLKPDDEALKKAREFVKFKEIYQVFICHPDTRVTEMGNLEYPEGFRPKKIHERTGTR